MVVFQFWDKDKDPAIVHPVSRNGISHRWFEIPPGQSAWEVGAAKTFDVDTTILSLHPHMHLRGVAAKYTAYLPDGSEEVLLDVPRYDYNWQLYYEYAEPREFPAGTKIKVDMTFDNSKENASNPDPSRAVRFGASTSDEMALGWMYYSWSKDGKKSTD